MLTVSLVVVLHEEERVVVDVAVEVHVRSAGTVRVRKIERTRKGRLTPRANTTCTFAAPDGGRRTTPRLISVNGFFYTGMHNVRRS